MSAHAAGRVPRRDVRSGCLAALAMAVLLGGCSAALRRGGGFERQGEWLKAVTEYRTGLKDRPGDTELKSRLIIAEQRGANFYYARGQVLRSLGKLDEAIAEIQKGLLAMPGNDKLAQALAGCLAEREAVRNVKEAESLARAGNVTAARELLSQALVIFPESALARAALERMAGGAAPPGLASARASMNLRLDNLDTRAAFAAVARGFAVRIVVDEGVKNQPVTIHADEVSLEQALSLLLASTKTFYRVLGPSAVQIMADTPAQRELYEDVIIRTFPLNSMKASDMAALLKAVLNLRQITVNEALKTIVIRDTADILKLADQLIQVNDRKPAEVLIEVEVLEVNRTKAEQLGIDYGSQAKLEFPQTTVEALLHGRTPAESVFQQGTVTLPTVVLNLFKQDVNAKVLANPKIRVLDSKAARIHIGDRVPLRTSTILDATGQVRVTYDYKDIGIKVETTPTVNMDNSVMIKVNLEVSALGANLGTVAEPSYVIGARNVDTVMILRDGETAMVGGLLRDEERNTVVKIPGLGDIPVIGPLFTIGRYENTGTTDILMTLTPHVVRGWSAPSREQRELYSGSAGRLTGRRMSMLPEPAPAAPAMVSLSASAGSPSATASQAGNSSVGESFLGFSNAQYGVSAGNEVEVTLEGGNLPRVDGLVLTVAIHPDLVQFVGATAATSNVIKVDAAPQTESGNIELQLAFQSGVQPGVVEPLARLRFRGTNAGVSYLIIYLNHAAQGADGKPLRVTLRPARIAVN